MTMMRIDDLIITIAYFSIPIQILVSLYRYPLLQSMPRRIFLLFVLFALFIFLCGAGHLLRALGRTESAAFRLMNVCTAIISLLTAVYLLPLIPHLFDVLDQALKKKEELEEAKNRKLMTFMGFLCHEIRNPLFAITSSVSFLGDDAAVLTDDQKTSLECIRQSSELMLRLVNDVLDISRLLDDSGQLQLEAHVFDLHEMMDGVSTSIRTFLQDRHGTTKVQFERSLGPDVPQFVCGDSVRILQIVYNLLSNAAKFTHQGRVSLSVVVESCTEAASASASCQMMPQQQQQPSSSSSHFGADNNKCHEHQDDTPHPPSQDDSSLLLLRITVQDTGCGIAPDRLDRIFEPFSQAKISDYRKHGGTGLGLSIVARLLDMMGGSIHVTSVVDVGSTFVVHLPVRAAAHHARVVPTPSVRWSEQPQPTSVRWSEPQAALHNKDDDDDDNTQNAMEQQHHQHKPFRKAQHDEETTEILSSSDEPIETDLVDVEAQETTKNDHSGSDQAITTRGPLSAPPSSAVSSSSSPDGGIPAPRFSVPSSSPPYNNNNNSHQAVGKTKFHFEKRHNVVLVTDDNAMNRKLLGRMLQSFQLETDFACNGQEAVDKVAVSRNQTGNPQALHYGLVLMDWSMPVMDGRTAVTRIRQMKSAVPIIALTAHALQVTEDEAMASGCSEFATKPIRRDDLNRKCQVYLATSAVSAIEELPI